LIIRPYQTSDSISEITGLLHRAYAPLLNEGMRYVASYQDDKMTRSRLTDGFGFVAYVDSTLVGTITVYNSYDGAQCEWYSRKKVWHFGQFAVEPSQQGTGFGRLLMQHVEEFCKQHGATELALDTSVNAHSLIDLYQKLGYRKVGNVNWEVTNYLSVVLSKTM